MNLEEQTKDFIERDIKYFYHKAIEKGVEISPIEHTGSNLYTVKIGNATLTYLGNIDGTASLVGVNGDIFSNPSL